MKQLDRGAGLRDVYLSRRGVCGYLLPECTYLERDEGIGYVGTARHALRQQVVEPIGGTRRGWQISGRAASGWDLGRYYPWRDMQTRQLYQLNGDRA